MEIVAKLTHSQARAKDFFRFHLTKRSASRYVYFTFFIMFIITGVVFIFLRNYYNALFFLFVAVLIVIIKKVILNIELNKIVKDVRFPTINYTLKINFDGIIYETKSENILYNWSKFDVIYNTTNYVYFYIDKKRALILYKYSLSEEDRGSLNNLFTKVNVNYRKIKF